MKFSFRKKMREPWCEAPTADGKTEIQNGIIKNFRDWKNYSLKIRKTQEEFWKKAKKKAATRFEPWQLSGIGLQAQSEGKSGNRAGVRAGTALGAGGFINRAFVVDEGKSAAGASIDAGTATDAFLFINVNSHQKTP